MTTRSISSTIGFPRPFTLSGYPVELPSGQYEVLFEEELLRGDSFEAYRRTATFMTVPGRGGRAGWTELHAVTDRDLEAALGHGAGRT